jgi:hypothetical protein
MWHQDKDTGAPVWQENDRTASIASRRTAIAVDPYAGGVHLSYQFPNGSVETIVYPPAVARAIGAALIEAGVLASHLTPETVK